MSQSCFILTLTSRQPLNIRGEGKQQSRLEGIAPGPPFGGGGEEVGSPMRERPRRNYVLGSLLEEIEKENLRQQQAEGGEALEAAGKDDGARGEARQATWLCSS